MALKRLGVWSLPGLLLAVTPAGCRRPKPKALTAGLKGRRSVPADAPTETSPWGEQSGGLRCRIVAAPKIERGMPLEARIEFRGDPEQLPPGMKRLNYAQMAAWLVLRLTDKQTGGAHTVRPYEPWPGGGPYHVDDGSLTAPLDGSPIEPWKATFHLVKLRDELAPGEYDCWIEYSYSREANRWWRGSDDEWREAGFWTGGVRSGPFTLTILPETPKVRRFVLPKRLRLAKGYEVVFTKEDAEDLDLAVRNGHFVGFRTTTESRDRGRLRESQGGPPVPGGANPIGSLPDYTGGGVDLVYTLELFETTDPPVHMWQPAPGHGGYKTLWMRSFRLRYTAEEIDAVNAPDHIAWGEVVDGLQAGLAFKTPLEAGDAAAYEIRVRNVGARSLLLRDARFDGNWRVIFTPREGGIQRRGGRFGIWSWQKHEPQDLSLEAGGWTFALRGLSFWTFADADASAERGNKTATMNSLPPGSYTVTASYGHPMHEMDKPCPYWHGTVTTGEVEAEIVPRQERATEGSTPGSAD